MQDVLLMIHLFLALGIIGLVLIQRSEGGGLGIGGGSGGLGGLATPKGTANILTRATAICAGCFFATSLLLGILAGNNSSAAQKSILDALQTTPAAQQSVQEEDEQESEIPLPLQEPVAPLAE